MEFNKACDINETLDYRHLDSNEIKNIVIKLVKNANNPLMCQRIISNISIDAKQTPLDLMFLKDKFSKEFDSVSNRSEKFKPFLDDCKGQVFARIDDTSASASSREGQRRDFRERGNVSWDRN